MTNTETVNGKYIFLDIVNYSSNRTVEAQTDIITNLNKIVKEVLNYHQISDDTHILIPTGDGICIALLNLDNPFDIHIKIALKILELLKIYNTSQKDTMRVFNVRIGINENTDNLIVDINGRKNIAGVGINEAQRIMDQGDANNILLGTIVFNKLRQRESYMKKFRGYRASIKHNLFLDVYQFIDKSIEHLNSEIPNSFNKSYLGGQEEPKFSKLIAYLVGHLEKNREFILKNAGDAAANTSLFALMIILAIESENKSEKKKFDSHIPSISKNLQIVLQNMESYNYILMLDYTHMFFEVNITPYWGGSIFSGNKYFLSESNCLEISKEGIDKLKKEWPEIIKELEI